jgi:hypothetical protein
VSTALKYGLEWRFSLAQDLSMQLEGGSAALIDVVSRYEVKNSKAFAASLAVSSLMEAYLEEFARGGGSGITSAGSEGDVTAMPLEASPEKSSLQTQLSAMKEHLETEIQVRSSSTW